MKKWFSFLIIFGLSFQVMAVSIETANKKNIDNVKILKESPQEIEYIDEDGKINRIDRSYVINIKEDGPKKPDPPKMVITQMFGNEAMFQGVSLFGDRLARRNGDSYQSVSQAYNVMTFVAFTGLPKGFEMDIAGANPLTARSNTDRDGFYQNLPGGASQNQTVINSFNSGTLGFDPNMTKKRDENNKLLDYFFTRFHYNHETKAFGTFGIGAITIHTADPVYMMRFLYAVSWKAPQTVLPYLNPNVIAYTYMLNEAAGAFQGNSNIRFNIFHKYVITDAFAITPSVTVGYLNSNNNINREKGIGDVTTNVKFSYLDYFINLNHVRRSDTLFDNGIFFPGQGVYTNANGDGMVADPSRINGAQNALVTNQITQNVSDSFAREYLIKNYQNQRVIRDIFFINIGYTLRF
jgi:hypothetical protein